MEVETENKSKEYLNQLKDIIENVTKCEVTDIYCKKGKMEDIDVEKDILEIKVKKLDNKEVIINLLSYKNEIPLKMCLQEAMGHIIDEIEEQNS